MLKIIKNPKIIKKILELTFVGILVALLDLVADYGYITFAESRSSYDVPDDYLMFFSFLMFFPVTLNWINEYLNKSSEKKPKMSYHLIFTFFIFIISLYFARIF